MTYIRIPLETNPQQLAIDVFNYIQLNAPNWSPNEGNLDVWIIRALADRAADLRTLASDVQDDIFASFGSSIMGIPPLDAVAASGDTTWYFIDDLGHTIPANTYIAIENITGDLIAFRTLIDIQVPAGSNSTAVGAVTIMAVDPGITGNDLSNNPTLIDVLDFVDHIVLESPTGGGVDAETFDDYLDRLVRRLHRLSTRPILAADFALAALDADPGVFRSVAIDGYNPDDGTYNNPKYVAVANVDAAGEPVSAEIKANVLAYLEENREVNFVVKVFDPNYTTIDVAATIVLAPNYTAADTNAAVVTAITDYLDPANWGVTAYDPREWVEQETVYYNEMIALVSNVTGVDRVSDLTMNISGNAPGRADIALTAPASLTRPGAVTSVVAP